VTGEPPAVAGLLFIWRRRADDREASVRRFGPDLYEGRIMAATAAEIRACIAELEAAIAVSRKHENGV
jgi:hypothetical protein